MIHFRLDGFVRDKRTFETIGISCSLIHQLVYVVFPEHLEIPFAVVDFYAAFLLGDASDVLAVES